MEILILIIAVLTALVVIDAGYSVVISVVRWTPVLGAGVAAFWFSRQAGAESLQALGIGFLICVVARHFMRPLHVHDQHDVW